MEVTGKTTEQKYNKYKMITQRLMQASRQRLAGLKVGGMFTPLNLRTDSLIVGVGIGAAMHYVPLVGGALGSYYFYKRWNAKQVNNPGELSI